LHTVFEDGHPVGGGLGGEPGGEHAPKERAVAIPHHHLQQRPAVDLPVGRKRRTRIGEQHGGVFGRLHQSKLQQAVIIGRRLGVVGGHLDAALGELVGG